MASSIVKWFSTHSYCSRSLLHISRHMCSVSPGKTNYSEKIAKQAESKQAPPDPPPEGLCCGSGCQNCVWLNYADEMIRFYEGNVEPDKIMEGLKGIQDPNLRMFLEMEMKFKFPKMR